ncbi:MAG: ExeM/NucH family extracellular endonuclease, partial [Acidimicrobiia bacterium]|nr:ExeM/NucH family extracellular endonuclease [Acidimicrobiia bacterium]
SFIDGASVHVAFRYVSSGTGGGSAANWRLDAIEIFSAPSVWVINEIHADPDGTPAGDANGDGTRDSKDDEFVEIINSSDADLDISGWTISDGFDVRHTFPAGTVVSNSCAVVVFGGGTPTGAFGGSSVQTASSGRLGLNNGGDSVTLKNGDAEIVSYGYGGEGGDNQSLTRDPDVTGSAPLVKHSTATGSGGALFSPGTKVDGSVLDGCTGPDEVFIHDVQGDGMSSTLAGQLVVVEGIVVGDFQSDGNGADGDLGGFNLQEEDADADADSLTSEGVFVFDGATPAVDVAAGDLVRVTGLVSEVNGLTEITPTSVEVSSSGNPLPAATLLTFPVSATDALEAYEGMSVTVTQPMYISEFFNFDRYNEVVLTSARQFQATAVFTPGSPDAALLASSNALGRITLDDGRTESNPDPALHPNGAVFDLTNLFRGGDVVNNVTGVIDYARDLYRIQPTEGADYTALNARTSAPDDVGGSMTVAAFNVLNYFTTLDSRGADTEEEFRRQRDKIFSALAVIDADVVGLIEIENNGTAVDDLVTGLNSVVGAGTYAYVDTGPIGPDEIAVAFIYKPETVDAIGAHAVLDDAAFLDPNGLGEAKNRPALAQTFQDKGTGGVATVVVNHLKSKGSECGPADDDPEAGSCNLTRTLAAQALADWLDTDPTDSGDEDFLIIGDLNSYDKEDPIVAMEAAGYTDLVGLFGGEFAYSYVFDGSLGYLDYAMANEALLDEVTGVTVWHINADEPDLIDYDVSFKKPAQDLLYAPDAYRSSDHDPVVIGLALHTAKDLKEATSIELSALLPTGDRQDDHFIQKAIGRVDDSLNPARWTGPATLDLKTGKLVFDADHQAVQELVKVATVDVQWAIDWILTADRQLALQQLNAAILGGGNPSRIVQAQANLADAAAHIAVGDFVDAVLDYKKAWVNAVKAQ